MTVCMIAGSKVERDTRLARRSAKFSKLRTVKRAKKKKFGGVYCMIQTQENMNLRSSNLGSRYTEPNRVSAISKLIPLYHQHYILRLYVPRSSRLMRFWRAQQCQLVLPAGASALVPGASPAGLRARRPRLMYRSGRLRVEAHMLKRSARRAGPSVGCGMDRGGGADLGQENRRRGAMQTEEEFDRMGQRVCGNCSPAEHPILALSIRWQTIVAIWPLNLI
jgi:hypothetical protein